MIYQSIIFPIIANPGAYGNSQSVKNLRLIPGKFGSRPEECVGLGIRRVVAEADPDGARFQGSRALVGQGRAVQPGADGNALPREDLRRFL